MVFNVRSKNSNDPVYSDVQSAQQRPPDNSAQEGNPDKQPAGRPGGPQGRTGVRNQSSTPKAPSTGAQLKMRQIDSPALQPASLPASGTGAASEHSWDTSGPYIKGSVEYDLADNDRQALAQKEQAWQDAVQRRDDAKSNLDSVKNGPKTELEKLYGQARTDADHAKSDFDNAKPILTASMQQHLANASPYVGGQPGLDKDNRLMHNRESGPANPVYSATDTRNILDQAANHAKDTIDADLKRAWASQVNDIRAWREKGTPSAENPDGTDAEDIHRQTYKDSEAYILLQKSATQKKQAIDEAVSAFKRNLDPNQQAVAREVQDNGSKDRKMLLESMNERATNLENAVADINDQRNMFSALASNTVNQMRVGTDKTAVPPYVSEQTRIQGGRDKASAEGQREIDSTVKKIESNASLVADAAHDALPMETPASVDEQAQERLNANFEKAQTSMLEDMRSAGKDLKEGLENLSEETTRLGKWNVPGAAGLPSFLGALELGKSLMEFDQHAASYLEKSRNGTLSSDDKQQMVDDVRHMVGSVVPYIPVIGPVLAPFVTIGNTIADLIEENKPSPVQKVATAMESQTARYLSSGSYAPVQQPQA
jgi:hypothetical protein